MEQQGKKCIMVITFMHVHVFVFPCFFPLSLNTSGQRFFEIILHKHPAYPPEHFKIDFAHANRHTNSDTHAGVELTTILQCVVAFYPARLASPNPAFTGASVLTWGS